MLPPIDETVLKSNPNFAALYANLSGNILNPDGATKHLSAHKEQDEVSKAYKEARIRHTKQDVIITALQSVDLESANSSKSKSKPTPPLPPELIEIILLLSAILSTSTPTTASMSLQSTPLFSALPTHLPQISALISTHLQTLSLHLVRLTSPSTNPSYLHRQIPSLPLHASTLLSTITKQRHSLALQRTTLTTLVLHLLTQYHVLTKTIIHILEQSKHGLISRHTQCKTEFLTLRAKEVALKGKEKVERAEGMVYTEKVKDALAVYLNELRGARERWGERGREARRVLLGYGVGREGEEGRAKERRMREVARVYGELMGEMEGVRRDLVRLSGGRG